jgi:hypothetical protein
VMPCHCVRRQPYVVGEVHSSADLFFEGLFVFKGTVA